MEINGLPLHALVIHGAVVFGPLSAVLALAYVALPRRRESFRWPMVLAAGVAVVFVVVAYLSGQNLLERNPALDGIEAVRTHADRAVLALWVVIVFAALALLRGLLLHTRTGGVRVVLDVLLAVAAVATVVTVVATGDAGAQAMWAGAN